MADATRKRYLAAITLLLDFWHTYSAGPNATRSLDIAVSEFVEHLYQEGDPLGLASDALAALQYYHPDTIGKLKYSWKLTGLWRKLEPPNQVVPFTNLTVLALAGAAYDLGLLDITALLLLGFDRFLRSGELFKLRVACLSVGAAKIVVTLTNTKTSKRKGIDEQVTVTSPLVIRMLKASIADQPKSALILRRSVSQCRVIFRHLLDLFDINDGSYNFYSLRRGGATSFFFQTGSMDQTIVVGRWEHTSTARIYINQSAAVAAEIKFTPEQMLRMQDAAALLNS